MRADRHISASLWAAPFGLSLPTCVQNLLSYIYFFLLKACFPFKKSVCTLFLTSIAAFLFATTVSYGQTTGHSNIRISDAVTVNGAWSGSNGDGWVFTPTADNANVRTSDIEGKLRYGTVSVTTLNSSGTQLGSVYLDDDLNVNDNDQYRFSIEANGNVELNDYVYLYTTNYNPGHHVTIKAGGNIESTSIGHIYTSGGHYNGTSGSYYVGVSAGDIYLEAGGYIDLKGQLRSEGGDRTSTSYNNRYAAGDGGDIYLRGVGGVRFTTILNSAGVNSYSGGYNGSDGTIEISTDNGVVTDGGDNDGQVSGSITGGAFTKSGTGVLQLTGSNDWTSTTIEAGTLQMGSSGSIPSSKNLVLDGVLDLFGADLLVSNLNGSGRVTTTSSSSSALRVSGSGTFSGVIEDGSGTLSIRKTGGNEFTLSGNNTYSGLTEVSSNGKLYIGHSNALGSTVSGTLVTSGSMLGLEGDISVGEESLSITGTGYGSNSAPLYNVSGSNTWSGTVSLLGDSNIRSHNGSLGLLNTSSIVGSDYDVSFRGVGTTTVGGVIALGSGGINKLDTGVLTLSGNNTYEGATSITGGALIASNDNALGTLDSGTTVSSGESLVLSGGVTITEPLTVTGSGYSGYGALSSIGSDNSYSGEIVLSSSTTIDTQTGTFTLDGTTAISATAARYLTLTGDGDLLLEGQVSLPSNSRITLDSGAHLKMGASDVLSSSIDLEFNGGSFYTQGYNNELDQLILTEDSKLYLGTGSHTLRFAEAGTFNFRKLTINDWSGTYGGSGVSGSAGKLFVTADVNREKLDQIDYYNSSDSKDYYTLQLESQELVPGDDRLGTPTGYSNVRISDAVTVNGEWSGSNSSGWIFTPTADNANVRTSDIEGKLRYGTVSVTTLNSSGTQLGSVYLDDDLNVNDNDQYRFSIEANGNVELNDYVYLYTTNYNPGHHVTIKAGGNIESTSIGHIYTSGGHYNGTSGSYYVGVSAGDIYLEAGGYIDLKGQLRSEGGDRTSTSYNNRYAAGDGGDIYLRGVGGVRFTTILNSAGVNSYSGGYNGSDGTIEISTDNGVVTDGGDNDGQVSGSITGGAFTKSGTGVLQLTGSNDWTSTTIEAGTLQMGSSGSIPSSKNLLLSGGTLESFGASKSYGSLSFTANSSIELGSGNHTLTFSSRGSFGSAELTIKGWVGTFGSTGVSGTEGKLKINTTLSASELAKIKFYNSVDGLYYAALQLSTKEIVPGAVIP